MTTRRTGRRTAVAALVAVFLLSILPVMPVAADSVAQSLPFSQNWGNTGLITTDDNWAGVPGITGSRGDSLTATTGTDPQTVLVDNLVTDVQANQTNPDTLAEGGVAEFEIVDSVVALQGSGTARAPYLTFALNTTGMASVNVSYNLRDIDGSADDAVQQFALQYRLGDSGTYTNLPAGYVADATTGPNLATLVTPVSVTLPAAANDQPIVDVRVITTDATGSDEWVGVDDIKVTGMAASQDAAPTVSATTPVDGASGVALGANLGVTFSEPVDVADGWTSISCASSGTHDATVSGGPTSFTLDPTTDFSANEACTWTILGAKVTDQDAIDPPNEMAADRVVNFTTATVNPDINVSQVYGGGGNAGATYRNDFIELYNPGTTSVALDGWSVQYAAAAGSIWAATPLTGTIPAGSWYLVAEAKGAGGVIDLPTPDASGSIAMSATAGKVALVRSTTALSGACPAAATIVDLVGYGATATCFEGAGPAPALTNTTADLRAGGGATDTDNNAADFTAGAPTPRPTVDPGPTVTATTPANGATGVVLSSNLTVSFSEPVAATSASFALACGSTGTHTVTVTGGPITFTLDPLADLGDNESCTLTVLAAGVTDLDPQDPPNAMAADVSVSFSTAHAEGCGDPVTPIHTVQGSGLVSPLVGQNVAIEGIVVGDYQDADQLDGFHVQAADADADADPATSEGIFVFDDQFGVAVQAGDHVRVRGTVSEFNGLTELSAVSLVIVCGTGDGGAVTPAQVSLPVASLDDLERFEGMEVHFSQTLTATEVFNLGRFGEVSLSSAGRLYTGTAVADPGAPALAVSDLNARSRIVLDDGNGQQNIDPTRYPAGGLSGTNTLRVGDTLPALTGVLEYRFGVYRIQPVGPISFDATNPRPAAPAPVGGNVRVASFNVLNFFNGDGLGGGFPTSRGATTAFELARQKAKIVSAITTIDADIVGLMEIENDAPPHSAIEELVDALNAATAPGTYAFIDTGVIGTDEIRVALIYQPAAVTPVGPYKVITSAVDPRFIDTLNRPSLAQTFERNATGARLTVVVNHLKSKGSDCNAVGDPDTGDGQGNCNLTRTKAAQALVDWLATDPTGSGDPDVLLIGDLNSYAHEDPVTAITGGGYTNLVAAFGGATAYSYVFNGESGYLDHGLATASLASQVTGAADWHINPDEPTALDYNTEFKTANQVTSFYDPGPYRASDHDPVVIGLNLDAAPTVDAGGPYEVVEGGSGTVTATGVDPDGDTLTYAWDLDNDGTFETAGRSATFSAAGLEAPLTRTIGVRVTDPHGLVATGTATVRIVWPFGFRPPLIGDGSDTAKAGSKVSIKFSLTGDQGTDLFKSGYPASSAFACGTTPPTDATEPAAVANPLQYNASRDEYTFGWKTDKSWVGTCRVFVLGLRDGTSHEIAITFR